MGVCSICRLWKDVKKVAHLQVCQGCLQINSIRLQQENERMNLLDRDTPSENVVSE